MAAASDSDDPGEDEEDSPAVEGRDKDLLSRRTTVRDTLEKLFNRITKGFQDQADRSDDLEKWWNIHRCILDDNQFYDGDAHVYVPLIHDAIEARVTRFSNQMFPTSGHYIDCTSSDGEEPYEIIALANHYIQQGEWKTQMVKPLFTNADIEGQFNLYISPAWSRRQIVSRETRPAQVVTPGGPAQAEGEKIEDIVVEDVDIFRPAFEVLHDSDVLILPSNAENVEDALDRDGCVVIVRRWTEDDIDRMIKDKEILKSEGEDFKKQGMFSDNTMQGLKDTTKQLIKSVGIKAKGKHTIAFECWTKLPLNDNGDYAKSGTPRLCRVWLGINRQQLGAKRNPYWNDRCPLFSRPVSKIAGAAKGASKVEPLAELQYEANNAANERADTDHLAAMPVVIRKPGEYNRPLILNKGAQWDEDPANIKFAEFPDLSARGRARIMDAQQIIFQSLGVNPAMLPSSGRPGSKRNQAEVAMEQSVDLLTTAEGVSVAEPLLSEVVSFVIDLDHQFRDNDLTVRQFGEMGVMAEMIAVPPLQNRTRFDFRWNGAEQARFNVAMQQQGTALFNIARGMKQDLMAEGYELKIGPALQKQFLNIFGPKIAAISLVDLRHQLSMDPEIENTILIEGMPVTVHKLDMDEKHIPVHVQALQETGDPFGIIKMHIDQHVVQMNAKRQAQLKAMLGGMMGMGAPPGAQGVPGGPPQRPGVAGTPPPGAVPAGPRAFKGPPGQIHPDRQPRMGGGSVVQMPRKM